MCACVRACVCVCVCVWKGGWGDARVLLAVVKALSGQVHHVVTTAKHKHVILVTGERRVINPIRHACELRPHHRRWIEPVAVSRIIRFVPERPHEQPAAHVNFTAEKHGVDRPVNAVPDFPERERVASRGSELEAGVKALSLSHVCWHSRTSTNAHGVCVIQV